jgi:hypothetical protein
MSWNSGLRTVSKLDGKVVVAGLAVVVDVEEPQVLCSGGAREVFAGCNHKSEAAIAQLSVLGDYAKHESSHERRNGCTEMMPNMKVATKDATAVLFVDLCRWRGAGKKAWSLVCLSLVRASSLASLRDCGRAVQGEVCTGETFEGELLVAGR